MDAILLPPAAPAVARDRHANPAVLGFLIGAAVPALVASTAWWLGVWWIAAIAAAGIAIGAGLGAVIGEKLVSEAWIGVALLAAFCAPVVPALLITVGVALTAATNIPGSDVTEVVTGVAGILAFGLLVLAVAEVGGLPITVPVALVVALLVRRAARMPAHRAAIHVGALVIVALAVGLVTLAAMGGLLLPLGIPGVVDPGY
jgi:hypothetical protein